MTSIPRDVWNRWRERMPVSKSWAYFDHAAVGPLSEPAAQSLQEFVATASNHGDVHWMDWKRGVERLRSQTAELTGCETDEVVLVPNTSTGINLVAEGLDWRAGDNVVIPEGEFPSNSFPWHNQAHRGVEVRVVARRDQVVDVDDLMRHVDERTRILSVSWVGYASGYRIDLERLVDAARARGVLVFLDAIQGLGIFPLDLKTCDVDFLAADGHKWLLGPEGAGVTIIRRRHLKTLRAATVGWASVKQAHQFSHASFELRDDAARFECGSANMSGLMALSASLEMFLEVGRRWGRDAIGNRVLERSGKLRAMLTEAGAQLIFTPNNAAQQASGIVTFRVPGVEPADFRQRGLDHGVVVSCRGGGIRASVHVYNDDHDLERLVALID